MTTTPSLGGHEDELENNFNEQSIGHVRPEEVNGLGKLPMELWLRIFSHLQPADLRASTLACSAFRWLAQPLLFTVFDVSPFFLAYDVDRRIFRPRKYLDRTVERLQFYCSVHIAPAVRHCWISPYSRSGFPPRNSRDYLDPELVIDRVIAVLPSFPNLRYLSWHCINFSARWWDSIQKLPIEVLWINSCTFSGDHPRHLPVRYLDLDQWAWRGKVTNHPSIHELHSSGVSKDVLSLVLHPEHIQHISVPRSDTCIRLLSTMVMMDQFVSLWVLRIPFSVIYSAEFEKALINCPSLRELRIFTPVDAPADGVRETPTIRLPPSALQSLSMFEGPYTLLAALSEGRHLKNVMLWGLDGCSSHCDPSRLANTLRQLSLLNTTLVALHTSVSCITLELLTAISSFSVLQSLELISIDNLRVAEPSVTESNQRRDALSVALLYDTLRSIQLPPRIETLRMFTQLGPGNMDIFIQEQKAMELSEYIAQAHPLLQCVEIGYGSYWTGTCISCWKRSTLPVDGDMTSLGNMNFKVHRRNIIFPSMRYAPLSTNSTSESKAMAWRIVMWACQLFRRYFNR